MEREIDTHLNVISLERLIFAVAHIKYFFYSIIQFLDAKINIISINHDMCSMICVTKDPN